ncbi:hypothetical protein V2G26_020504 [Clonostachys chloroleuca]
MEGITVYAKQAMNGGVYLLYLADLGVRSGRRRILSCLPKVGSLSVCQFLEEQLEFKGTPPMSSWADQRSQQLSRYQLAELQQRAGIASQLVASFPSTGPLP